MIAIFVGVKSTVTRIFTDLQSQRKQKHQLFHCSVVSAAPVDNFDCSVVYDAPVDKRFDWSVVYKSPIDSRA